MMAPRLSWLVPCLLIVAAVGLKVSEPEPVVDFQNRVFDYYQKLKPRVYEPAPVRIVDIDDETLARVGQWPWPRPVMAKLVEKLQGEGAAAIAFDIAFAEPDRTSPRQIAALWNDPSLADLPDHDEIFAHAIASAPVVTGFVLTHGGASVPAVKGGFAVAGDDPSPFLPAFTGSVTTLAVLEKEAKGNGALNSEPGRDGIIRRLPLVFTMNGTLYPSLAAEALRVAQGAGSHVAKAVGASGEAGGTGGMVAIKTGDVVIPTDRSGGQWLYYTQASPERYIPAWQVLEGVAPRDKIEGNIIFVGTSAAGLKDIRATPLSPVLPGVEVFAESVEQAMLGVTLSRPDWIRGAEIALMAAAGLLLLAINAWLTPLWGMACLGLILVGALGVSWVAFADYRLLVEPVMPVLAVILVYFSDALMRYVRAERERAQVRTAFAQYMSPALVDELARHPERLTLGGEIRPLSVMFCDMCDFTSISENLPPEQLTRLVSRFLTPITEVVLDHKGTIDKYIGDCVMAFWNAPLDDPDHAKNAARSALAIQDALEAMNAQSATGPDALQLRATIGINTDSCCVGNMGTDSRFNYSALGDGVNLAARLQSQCRHYGADIIIGEATAKELGMACLELDLVRVKGKGNAVHILALMGDEIMAASPSFATLLQKHHLLLDAYRKGAWDKTDAALADCCKAAGAIAPSFAGGIYERFAARIAALKGTAWDGVYEAAEK